MTTQNRVKNGEKIFKKRRVFGGVGAVSGRGRFVMLCRAVGGFEAVAVCVAGLCFGGGSRAKFARVRWWGVVQILHTNILIPILFYQREYRYSFFSLKAKEL